MTNGRFDIADDATAEAFARALSHKDAIRDPLPWIYTVARRVAIAELKHESIVEGGAQRELETGEEILVSHELTEMLDRLTPSQRVVVFLHYAADMSLSDIASLTGSSLPSVKVRLFRARKHLRATDPIPGDNVA